MDTRFQPSKSGRQSAARRLASAALWIAAAVAGPGVCACVSLPGPAGPVRVEGPVPPAGTSGTAGTPESRVPQGPLLLRSAVLEHQDQGLYAWSVELVNPSGTPFDASLVVTLLDGDDGPVGSHVQQLRVGGGETLALSGAVRADREPSRFRIEYWVRLLPPPERRVERVGP